MHPLLWRAFERSWKTLLMSSFALRFSSSTDSSLASLLLASWVALVSSPLLLL